MYPLTHEHAHEAPSTAEATPSSAGGRGLDVAGVARLATGAVFILGTMAYAWLHGAAPDATLLAAAGFGAYMAMNIGANDVANNVGSAVGAKVLSLGAALAMAAVFEGAGALIGGDAVINTLRSGIIDPATVPDGNTLAWLMMAALLAAALWLNVASAVGAPVSTTHSIVGGVLGAGVAACGLGAVHWAGMTSIAASWVISPVLGGGIAAGLLYAIKRLVTYRADRVTAACRYLPMLMAMMAWAFVTYLVVKGLNDLWQPGLGTAVVLGLGAAALVYYVTQGLMHKRADRLDNSKQSINRLFGLPLIFSVALLSFAHGSNDVANALAPLATVLDLLAHGGEASAEAPIPTWVLGIGAAGIALGLALYGSRVISTVGNGITALDPMRAYCIALAAALTVVLASQLGLPVSTTHVTVGAVFGVGLLRERLKCRYACMLDDIRSCHAHASESELADFSARFEAADMGQRKTLLAELKANSSAYNGPTTYRQRRAQRQSHTQALVKRSLMVRIAAAWLITVPASAAMAALVFYTLRGFLLP